MNPLTLYIMRSDNGVHCPQSIPSFGGVVENSIHLEDRALSKAVRKCETKWFGYIFSNEFLEIDLAESLPLYFDQEFYDVIILMQRAGKGENVKFYQSPRLFKRNILLKGMVPLHKNFNHVRALDGFLEVYDENDCQV